MRIVVAQKIVPVTTYVRRWRSVENPCVVIFIPWWIFFTYLRFLKRIAYKLWIIAFAEEKSTIIPSSLVFACECPVKIKLYRETSKLFYSFAWVHQCSGNPCTFNIRYFMSRLFSNNICWFTLTLGCLFSFAWASVSSLITMPSFLCKILKIKQTKARFFQYF